MAAYSAREILNSATDKIEIRIPNPKFAGAILLRAQGTYVGTLRAQSADDADGLFNSTLSGFDATDGAAGPAANEEGYFVYEYAAGEDMVRIDFSAYTSGSVTVDVTIAPQTA